MSFLATVAVLVVLHNVVSSKASANRAGSFFSGAAGVLRRVADPTVPLITPKSSSASTSSSSGAVTVAPVATTTPANTLAGLGVTAVPQGTA